MALLDRQEPELVLRGSQPFAGPHGVAIRTAFAELGLAAVFCVEEVPTIGFLVQNRADPSAIDRVRRALWNQGLMSLLLVIEGDVLRAYSLVRRPPAADEGAADPTHIRNFQLVRDAMHLKEIVRSVESGRFWSDNKGHFDREERIDRVLLDNLSMTVDGLADMGLPREAAQALLMQAMFVAYLEDRDVLRPDVFRQVSAGRAQSLSALLGTGDVSCVAALFDWLRPKFNGDLFVAPCSFDPDSPAVTLDPGHLEILRRFRDGLEDMAFRQGRLFASYDFKYIPVALLSAVYDRFLKAAPEARREDGAYFTPMFLADVVVNQVWEFLTPAQKESGTALDPACGSGVFLVRLFERMVENRRRTGCEPSWQDLLDIASRLRGFDIDSGALRVAVFSLYLALLEQVPVPDIRALMEKGKLLPRLWNRTLRAGSFFRQPDAPAVDIVIGNPPWKGRRNEAGGAASWCAEHEFPFPEKEIAWAFLWKAGTAVSSDGVVGLLLPAMATLHNHKPTTVAARQRLFTEAPIRRIVNFADLAFLLFEGAERPAALLICGRHDPSTPPHRFDYWCPKADPSLRLRRTMTLSRWDCGQLRSDLVAKDTSLLKRRLWMRQPDEKLFQYLSSLPRMRDLIDEHINTPAHRRNSRPGWIIGQGFKPANAGRLNDPGYRWQREDEVTRYPYFDARGLPPVALSPVHAPPRSDNRIHRPGFLQGFIGPHVLVPQGVKRKTGRIRAAYSSQNLVFQHSIQAIKFPNGEAPRAKVLTAILNSRLAAWFALHATANLGADRSKIHQAELLLLPFPMPDDLADPQAASLAFDEIVGRVDEAIREANSPLRPSGDILPEVDKLVYRYFGLSEEETVLVEETMERLVPRIQPRTNRLADLWPDCKPSDRRHYADTLRHALERWLEPGSRLSVTLAGKGKDLAILRLRLDSGEAYSEPPRGSELEKVLADISPHLANVAGRNFQIMPDLRVLIDGDLYLVKPTHLRYWLRSTALADADEIAAELFRAQRKGPSC
ncbi:MAG: SAM-dependent methyltransferase [Magnetospirillum sp. WYHS-4]